MEMMFAISSSEKNHVEFPLDRRYIFSQIPVYPVIVLHNFLAVRILYGNAPSRNPVDCAGNVHHKPCLGI